jgi:hypothetical protein
MLSWKRQHRVYVKIEKCLLFCCLQKEGAQKTGRVTVLLRTKT